MPSNWVQEVNTLRLCLPSAKRSGGSPDQRSMFKLARELFEFIEEPPARKLAEVPDLLYYTAGAVVAGLIDEGDGYFFAQEIAKAAGLTTAQVYAATMAKYAFRAQESNPKDKAHEQMLVMRAIASFEKDRGV